MPVGGLYAVVDRRGRLTGGKRMVAAGRRFPPTRRPGEGYVLLGLRMADEDALRAHRAVYAACTERRPVGAIGG